MEQTQEQHVPIYEEGEESLDDIEVSIDLFFKSLMSVAVHFLIFRIFCVFLFAFLFAHEWHWQQVWGWFHIIAFNADPAEFETMHSYAVLTTALIMLGIFFLSALFSKPQHFYRTLAWFAGVLMVSIQYYILIYLNQYFNFGVRDDLMLEFFGIALGATVIMLIRYKVWTRRLKRKRNT